MGLDMYLTKRHYVKNWSFMKPEQKHKIVVKLNNKSRTDIDTKAISEVTEDVMYWRKANAIHNWFVTNCQDGEDDCRDSHVEREQLEELLNLCNQVLADNSKAEELLPSQSGFFFGGTDYDEWYFKDVEETKEALTKELSKPDNGYAEYYYHSSW